jgi:beta-carotene 3-hydroxylase
MHGFMWYFHEDHHQPKYENPLSAMISFLFFAIPSIALFLFWCRGWFQLFVFIGLGIAYGLLFHDT